MRVRMIARLAGPIGNCEPGGVIDLPPNSAKLIIELGYGVAIETTSVKAAESRSKPKMKKKRVRK